jgi:hypothetical protein
MALTHAEAAFARTGRERDPGWLAYFDEAYLAARMAHCFHAIRAMLLPSLPNPITRAGLPGSTSPRERISASAGEHDGLSDQVEAARVRGQAAP